MNFSFESIKLKSKAQNEDFYFDIETPRGHFFAVLDFAPHDYANLNATLKAKLETIVGSFVTLSRFSADLFLGFLAKEINNFLHNLGEQSGGPELLCSAALCLLTGNRLSYFICGDVSINILSRGRPIPLYGAESDAPGASDQKNYAAEQANEWFERLGARHYEAPFTDYVQAFTLQDGDIVLIMTHSLEKAFESRQLSNEVANLSSSDPKLICEALMKASAATHDDRTLVVISGPYERYVDPVLADLGKAVASLETRVDALIESEQRRNSSAASLENGQRFSQQIEVLKDDLRGKATKLDLLELDEKLKHLSVVLATKADTAEVLGLQRDVLKLGMVSNAGVRSSGTDEITQTSGPVEGAATITPIARTWAAVQKSDLLRTALVIFGVALLGALIGGWLQSRGARKPAEVWSVKTEGNQILISRLDGTGEGTVSLSVAQPLKSTGEQTFSSFADVKQYIDTITTPQSQSTQAAVSEIEVKPGDTLQKLSQLYHVPPEKIMALNPTITRWTSLQIGQKINMPASAAVSPSIAQ